MLIARREAGDAGTPVEGWPDALAREPCVAINLSTSIGRTAPRDSTTQAFSGVKVHRTKLWKLIADAVISPWSPVRVRRQ